eukprot:1138562-Pelagomonas_calceolata.AAC.1
MALMAWLDVVSQANFFAEVSLYFQPEVLPPSQFEARGLMVGIRRWMRGMEGVPFWLMAAVYAWSGRVLHKAEDDCKGRIHFHHRFGLNILMLAEKVPPSANQPESRAIGHPLVNPGPLVL